MELHAEMMVYAAGRFGRSKSARVPITLECGTFPPMPDIHTTPCATRVPRWAYGAAWTVVIVLAGLHLLYYGPRTVDDMFIFLRYAENFAAAEGLVYNPGERVEGFSSPLWVLLLGAGAFFGANLVTWAKVLGLMSFGALMVGVERAGRELLSFNRWVALGPCLFLALNSYVVSWSLWGLETPAYLALLIWVIVLARRVCVDGERGDKIKLGIVGAALSLARPEAPLFLAAIGVATVCESRRWREIKGRALRGLAPAFTTVFAYGAYLIFRRMYFGLWFPHTHYAKQGQGFALERWAPLVGEGATVLEVAFLVVGLVASVCLVVRRRGSALFAVLLANVFFVAVVLVDWMPNVRHLLPLWVVLPLLFAWAVERVWGQRHKWRRIGAIGLAGLGLSTGIYLACIDARYSPVDYASHGQGVNWVRYKGPWAARATWDCFMGVTPDQVERMDDFNHGMLAQLYRLVESDARPLRDTWYVGRDIGRVGWLAPVRVFDTDGLFTPEVVQSEVWQQTRAPDEALVEVAFDRDVAMTELMVGWVGEASRNRSVRRRYGMSPRTRGFNHLRSRDGQLPDAQTVLRRYQEALSKMPSGYYLMTLYGEAVGAALARRVRYVERALGSPTVSELPDGLIPASPVTLDARVEALGCSMTPTEVRPGEELRLECYFRARERVRRDFMVFVHLVSEQGGLLFNADHLPIGGFAPTSDWQPGEIMHDVHYFTAPEGASGAMNVRFGLFAGNHRAAVDPASMADEVGRLIGPSFTIAE